MKKGKKKKNPKREEEFYLVNTEGIDKKDLFTKRLLVHALDRCYEVDSESPGARFILSLFRSVNGNRWALVLTKCGDEKECSYPIGAWKIFNEETKKEWEKLEMIDSVKIDLPEFCSCGEYHFDGLSCDEYEACEDEVEVIKIDNKCKVKEMI